MLQTEFPFTLPCGYVDELGDLHRSGTIRLATAIDEVEPLRDARVRANQAYLSVLLLSRVVIRIGPIAPVEPAVVERLFSADFAFLQELYIHVDGAGDEVVDTQCPGCGERFALDMTAWSAGE